MGPLRAPHGGDGSTLQPDRQADGRDGRVDSDDYAGRFTKVFAKAGTHGVDVRASSVPVRVHLRLPEGSVFDIGVLCHGRPQRADLEKATVNDSE